MQITTNRFSFVSASLALMVTYVTSAVPIPLYGTYELYDHVSYWQLSLSSVVYFIGAAIPALISGQLSSHFSLLQIASGYGLLALFGSVIVLTSRLIKNPRQTSREIL